LVVGIIVWWWWYKDGLCLFLFTRKGTCSSTGWFCRDMERNTVRCAALPSSDGRSAHLHAPKVVDCRRPTVGRLSWRTTHVHFPCAASLCVVCRFSVLRGASQASRCVTTHDAHSCARRLPWIFFLRHSEAFVASSSMQRVTAIRKAKRPATRSTSTQWAACG
jgi:hypothetical protein